jgi:hypothetical protein
VPSIVSCPAALRALLLAIAALLLAGPASAGDDGEYFLVRHDPRRCDSARCGGFLVIRANQQESRCNDGTFARECYVAAIEPARGAGLSRDAIAHAIDAPAGGPGIIRARTEVRDFDQSLRLAVLVATESWRASGRGIPQTMLSLVDDARLRCVKLPCASLRVRALGARETRLVSALDLGGVHASQSDRVAASEASLAGGVIVAGAIRAGAEPGGDVFVASQAWLRTSIAPSPPASGEGQRRSEP